MKTILAFTLIVAGISASIVPEPMLEPGTVASPNSGIITGPIENQIIEGIEEVSQTIRDAGLDPLHIKREHLVYALPVPEIFNAVAFLEEVLSTGLSNIVVHDMNYSLILNRLTFEIVLPHIHLSARSVKGDVSLFGNTLIAEGGGRFDVRGTVARGVVRVNVGIISGISISSVTMDVTVGRITSSILLAIQGVNYSVELNQFITQAVPATLNEFRAEINELIGIIVRDIINEYL